MNKKILHIIGLVSCFSYLGGNIVYDLLDTPEHPANPSIFYIPLGVMIFSLILIIWEYAKNQSSLIHDLWLSFLMLSISQLIKFTIFNPYVRTVNDYALLVVVIIFTVKRLIRKRK